MNFNNFTIKAQEALQKAIEIAQGKNQQMIEPIHILKAIMIVGDNVTSFLFNKLGVNSHNLEKVVDAEIESLPRVSGGDPMLGRETNAVFQKAADFTSKMGDQFVSVEHILLAILDEKNSASRMMKDAGISLDHLQAAINDLRKGEKVTSQTAEDTYQALNKYAVNLIERARDGKLDPVIGRDEEIRRVLQRSEEHTSELQSRPHLVCRLLLEKKK